MEDTCGAVNDLLCRCLSGGWSEAGAELQSFSGDQWAELAREAIRHGVAPLLYRRLEVDTPGEDIPESVRRVLEDVYCYSSLRGRAARDQLATVLSAFAFDRIPTIVLKGAYLAEHVYSEPAERPFGDLDLLVPLDDTERAALTLQELGYEPRPSPGVDYGPGHHHYPPFVKPGMLPIELHRRLTRRRPIEEGVWSRARSVQLAGAEALALSTEDLVVHLCLHAASHKLEIPLRVLLDLHRVLTGSAEKIDWTRLIRLVREMDSGPFVYVGLALTQATLGVDVPAAVWEELQENEADQAIVETALALVFEDAPSVPGAYRSFIRQNGATAKVGSIARAIFPDRNTLDRIYGPRESSASNVWRRIARPVRLSRQASRWLWGLRNPESADRAALGREKKRLAVNEWLARRNLARD